MLQTVANRSARTWQEIHARPSGRVETSGEPVDDRRANDGGIGDGSDGRGLSGRLDPEADRNRQIGVATKARDLRIRYDILSLFWNGRRFEVRHFPDAFRPVNDPLRPWQWSVHWDRFLEVIAAQGNDAMAVTPSPVQTS